jgi:aryl-alcohol dehydrogenase-like predicted oxidoreductase
MKTRRIGSLEVSAIGLGCMGMSVTYGAPDDVESVATIRHALDRGVTFIDTADMYGAGANETLVGEALKGRRHDAILATKFGNLLDQPGKISGRPDYVQAACEASLKRLNTDVIDLYYQHRVDPDTPIDDTVGAMARLVEQGKIRHLGLSEAGAGTIARAHEVHPITALQSEYSLWSHDPEADVLPLCRDLGIGFVAYSPLGRGFLTGAIPSRDALIEGDRRRAHPRFADAAFAQNAAMLDALRSIAEARGATPAQIAIAWLLARGGDIVPIPGTKKRRWLDENIAAEGIALDGAAMAALDAAFRPGATAGTRYPAAEMNKLGR